MAAAAAAVAAAFSSGNRIGTHAPHARVALSHVQMTILKQVHVWSVCARGLHRFCHCRPWLLSLVRRVYGLLLDSEPHVVVVVCCCSVELACASAGVRAPVLTICKSADAHARTASVSRLTTQRQRQHYYDRNDARRACARVNIVVQAYESDCVCVSCCA